MITSSSNQRIKDARKLLTRKGRHAAGLMLVEGVRLLADAWRSGVRPETVFYAPDNADFARRYGNCWLNWKPPAACASCTAALFATLSETTTPQGIAAVLPLPQLAWPAQPRLLLILDGVSDPGNAGTLLRSAEAAGCDGVIFAPGAVDPFNDKVVRAGMSAHFRLPLRICATWPAVDALLPPGSACYLADAHATLDYAAVDWRAPGVLVVSNEAHGASAEARARSTAVTIPMCGGGESLNAAVAGSVFYLRLRVSVGLSQIVDIPIPPMYHYVDFNRLT
jgi:TrmH family RNA methyltransferase